MRRVRGAVEEGGAWRGVCVWGELWRMHVVCICRTVRGAWRRGVGGVVEDARGWRVKEGRKRGAAEEGAAVPGRGAPCPSGRCRRARRRAGRSRRPGPGRGGGGARKLKHVTRSRRGSRDIAAAARTAAPGPEPGAYG